MVTYVFSWCVHYRVVPNTLKLAGPDSDSSRLPNSGTILYYKIRWTLDIGYNRAVHLPDI